MVCLDTCLFLQYIPMPWSELVVIENVDDALVILKIYHASLELVKNNMVSKASLECLDKACHIVQAKFLRSCKVDVARQILDATGCLLQLLKNLINLLQVVKLSLENGVHLKMGQRHFQDFLILIDLDDLLVDGLQFGTKNGQGVAALL